MKIKREFQKEGVFKYKKKWKSVHRILMGWIIEFLVKLCISNLTVRTVEIHPNIVCLNPRNIANICKWFSAEEII